MSVTDVLLLMLLVSSMIQGALLYGLREAGRVKKIPTKHKRYARVPDEAAKPAMAPPVKRYRARDYPERPLA